MKPFDRAVRGAQTIFSSVALRLPKREEQVKIALACVLSSGHLLIEGPSGLGKTRLAETIATALGLPFSRVQMTADLMPSDITGFSVYHPPSHDFVFFEGPLFASIVLVDEINRASAKTQSAFLEAMSSQRVTTGNVCRALPSPFILIATANPLSDAGVFPLPMALKDRFTAMVTLGMPPVEEEIEAIMGQRTENPIQPIADMDLLSLMDAVSSVYMSEDLARAMVEMAMQKRRLNHPISFRSSVLFARFVRAMALMEGRDYATIEDAHRLAPYVFAHRTLS